MVYSRSQGVRECVMIRDCCSCRRIWIISPSWVVGIGIGVSLRPRIEVVEYKNFNLLNLTCISLIQSDCRKDRSLIGIE